MKKGNLLPIYEMGNSILRKKCKRVSFPLNDQTLHLIRDMSSTMLASDAVGIAAPQVGVSLQIVIVASRPNKRYPYAPLMKPIVMINPAILEKKGLELTDWEGCLSVPHIRGLVPCSDEIVVEYQDILGKTHEQSFSGFPARVVQHEVAHIQGLLFTDRVKTPKDLYSQTEFEKRLKRRSKIHTHN